MKSLIERRIKKLDGKCVSFAYEPFPYAFKYFPEIDYYEGFIEVMRTTYFTLQGKAKKYIEFRLYPLDGRGSIYFDYARIQKIIPISFEEIKGHEKPKTAQIDQ